MVWYCISHYSQRGSQKCKYKYKNIFSISNNLILYQNKSVSIIAASIALTGAIAVI